MFARPVLVGLLAAAPLVLAVACSSDNHPSTPTSPLAPSSAASSPGPAAAEAAALTAYRGMWSAFVEAAKTSDSEAPNLRKYASDNALKLIVSSLYTNKELGKVTKGDVALDPKILKIVPPDGAPSQATIEDCVDSTRWLEYKASGGLWDDKPGGKHRTSATAKKQQDGTWKVNSFVLEGSGTC